MKICDENDGKKVVAKWIELLSHACFWYKLTFVKQLSIQLDVFEQQLETNLISSSGYKSNGDL